MPTESPRSKDQAWATPSHPDSPGWIGRGVRKMLSKREKDYGFEALSSSSLSPMITPASEGNRPMSGLTQNPTESSGEWTLEEDTPEIRWLPAVGPSEIPQIKAATADKLVEWLTSAKFLGKSSINLVLVAGCC